MDETQHEQCPNCKGTKRDRFAASYYRRRGILGMLGLWRVDRRCNYCNGTGIDPDTCDHWPRAYRIKGYVFHICKRCNELLDE